MEIQIQLKSYKNGIYNFEIHMPLYMITKLLGQIEFTKNDNNIHQFFTPQPTDDLQTNVVTIQSIINHSHESLKLHKDIKQDAVLPQNIMYHALWSVEKEDLLIMLKKNSIPELTNKITGKVW